MVVALDKIYKKELIVISINTGLKSYIKFSIKAVYNTDDMINCMIILNI